MALAIRIAETNILVKSQSTRHPSNQNAYFIIELGLTIKKQVSPKKGSGSFVLVWSIYYYSFMFHYFIQFRLSDYRSAS